MQQWLFLVSVALLCASAVTAIEVQLTGPEARKLGDSAFVSGDLTEAYEQYKHACDVQPEEPLNWFRRGTVFSRRKKIRFAVADFTKCIDMQPDDKLLKKCYDQRAAVHMKDGQCHLAKADYTAVLKIDPKHKKATKAMPKVTECIRAVSSADALFDRRDFASAAIAYQAAMKAAHNNRELLLKYLQCFVEQNKYQELLIETRSIVKANPNDLEVLALRGLAYFYTMDLDSALAHFNRGLQSDPDHKTLKKHYKHVRKVKKLMDKRHKAHEARAYQDAVDYCDTILELAKDTHYLLEMDQRLHKCRALNELEKGKEALIQCNIVVENEPHNLEAWMQRGEAKIHLEDFDGAIADYEKAVELNQNSREAKDGLNRAKLEQKKAERKNYYKILEVSKKATKKEIKKAYKTKIQIHHPDLHQGDEEKAAQEKLYMDVVEAYEILSDPEERDKYDRGEDINVNMGGRRSGFNPFGNRGGGGGGGTKFHFNF